MGKVGWASCGECTEWGKVQQAEVPIDELALRTFRSPGEQPDPQRALMEASAVKEEFLGRLTEDVLLVALAEEIGVVAD